MVKNIIAGDSYKITFDAPYDSALYTPKMIINDGLNKYQKVGSGDFEINFSPAETAVFKAGEYSYSIFVFKQDERHTIDSGFLTVIGDIEQQGTDNKNKFQKIVDAIDSSVLGVATQAQKQMTINGRSIERFSPEELIKLRDKYQKLAMQEEKRMKNIPANKKIYVRF